MNNQLLINLGGIIAFVTLAVFSFQIWIEKVKPISSATWSMFVLIDLILLVSSYFAGKPYMLPLGYTVGALMVTAAHFKRGQWIWTWKEGLSLGVMLASTVVWLANIESVWGVYASIGAMLAAGAPMYYSLWNKPDKDIRWMLIATAIAGTISILGADFEVFSTYAVGLSGLLYNGSLAIIVTVRILKPEEEARKA